MEMLIRAEKYETKTYWSDLQDGEGDGMKSREGIPVTHYDDQLKEEVVAFAKATSQKEARDRFSGNLLEISDIQCNARI